MKKVIVRIKGGLGNQLFCYAAARRLAVVNNAELLIDDVTGFVRDRQYRRKYLLDRFSIAAPKATSVERMEPFERYRRALSKFINRRRIFFNRTYIEQEGIDFDSRLLELKMKGTVYLDGYWQSEWYFKDIEDVIRQDLCIRAPQDEDNRRVAKRIKACDSICVHIRWFEEPSTETMNKKYNLESGYYKRAVMEIRNRVEAPHFFLFADDPRKARDMLKFPEELITCVDHNRGIDNAYADLWLMQQCKHFIIANSTFSWWAAWLAESKTKIIISPKRKSLTGIQGWGFSGLIPNDWMIL